MSDECLVPNARLEFAAPIFSSQGFIALSALLIGLSEFATGFAANLDRSELYRQNLVSKPVSVHFDLFLIFSLYCSVGDRKVTMLRKG